MTASKFFFWGVGGGRGDLRFAERGVSVAHPRNVLGRGTVLNGKTGLSNHLTSVGADDVNAENAVGFGIGDELDKTLGVEVGLRARVGGEGEGADLVLDAGSLDLGLVLADPGDLRVCVHDRGDDAVVDVTVTLRNVLDGGDGLLLSLVGKHGAEGAVTDDADVGNLGAVLVVDDQAALVVGLDTNVLNAEAGGVRTTANGNENNICVDLELEVSSRMRLGLARAYSLLLATLRSLDGNLDALAGSITARNLGASLEFDALLLEDLLDTLGNLSVHAGATDLTQELDDGNLGAQARPNGSLLKLLREARSNCD